MKVNKPDEGYEEAEFDLVPVSSVKAYFARNFAVYSAILIAVAVGSFGLGRLSFYDENRAPVKINMPESEAEEVLGVFSEDASLGKEDSEEIKESNSVGGEVVGSRNSNKYHFPWCSGAKRISETNLITFASIEDARKAGYSPASNCKGLE